MFNKVVFVFSLLLLPAAFAFAANEGGSFGTLGQLIKNFINFINTVLVPFVFAIAFLVFIWGAVQYFILGGADEEKRSTGKSLMLWGIIAFVIMVSVWGIVNVLATGLGLTGQDIKTILPKAPSN